MKIDKEILKEYINTEYNKKFHIKEIIDYKIENNKIYRDLLSKESPMLKNPSMIEKGYIDIVCIRPRWKGWICRYVGTSFEYEENCNTEMFNIYRFQIWLREYKINQIIS